MRRVSIVAVLALLLAACSADPVGDATSTTEPASSDSPSDQLAAARERWAAASFSSYQYVFEDDCGECDPTYSEPQLAVVWDQAATASQPTIEELFAHIETAIADGLSVEVTYNAEWGHPTEIAIDMEARAYDGGTHLFVRDLEPGLPGGQVSLSELETARVRWEATRPDAYEFRTTIGCDCSVAGTLWTRVDGDKIDDWSVAFVDGASESISPITVDDMFRDLSEMLGSADGVVESGVRFTGSAEYHHEYGYPVWVGLDIEVIDPSDELAHLPPRVVFIIHDLKPLDLN